MFLNHVGKSGTKCNETWTEQISSAFCILFFFFSGELFCQHTSFLSSIFSRFIIKDQESFFTNAQRSLLVHELLLRTRYEAEKDKFGKKLVLHQEGNDCHFWSISIETNFIWWRKFWVSVVPPRGKSNVINWTHHFLARIQWCISFGRNRQTDKARRVCYWLPTTRGMVLFRKSKIASVGKPERNTKWNPETVSM